MNNVVVSHRLPAHGEALPLYRPFGRRLAMWYVVQVVGGRERRVLHLVEQLVDDDVL